MNIRGEIRVVKRRIVPEECRIRLAEDHGFVGTFVV